MTRRSFRMGLAPVVLTLLLAASSTGADGHPTATADDELPPAILGKAPALTGSSVGYFPAVPKAQGYLAEPAGSGTHPSVILIHEWNGLVQRMKETADAFAAEGYVALAVDLYSGRTGSNRDENMALVRETLAACHASRRGNCLGPPAASPTVTGPGGRRARPAPVARRSSRNPAARL